MPSKVNKKLLYIFLGLFFFSTINAQNVSKDLGLDEEFLNSLPEETKQELLKQLEDDQDNLRDVNFGVFSTLLDQNSAQKYIEQELLDKKILISPEKRTKESLTYFGSGFFSGFPTSFMPISEPSLSSDYLLDFGDLLVIEIYGSSSLSESISVKSDGSISIPKLGKLQVAGLSLNQAQDKATNYIANKMPGASISLSIEKIRDIQVVIVGYVEVPGIYTVSGNSSALSALRVAGGIKSGGSYREIHIKRRGELLATFDLYDLLLNGDTANNINLQAGDVVIVQPINEFVYVYGGVKTPSIFELKGESISELISFAGNSFNGQSIDTATLTRKKKDSFETSEVTKEVFQSIFPSGGDEIYIPYISNLFQDSVKIVGSASSPGVYSVEGAREAINSSNLLGSKAYPLAVIHKQFIKASNKYFYKLHEPSSIPLLRAGDELIVLSKKSVDFLDSNTFNSFILGQSSNADSCEFAKYLNDLRDSSRFQLIKKIYEPFVKTNYQINEQVLPNLGLEAGNQNASSISQIKKDSLFTSSDDNKESCIDLFEQDPELLLTLLRSSILVEGKNLISGVYPIANNTSLKGILDVAMLTTEIDMETNISITSNTFSKGFSFSEVDSIKVSAGENISISSKDTIEIGKVTIEGEVVKPGIYYISSQDKLSDIIKSAGGYTDSAYPTGGILTRESALKLEKEFNEKLYDETIKNLSSALVQGENIPYEAVSFVLNEFKSVNPSGRVITEFNLQLLQKDISSDLILENRDKITIPKRTNVVFVFGEVLSPGPQSFKSNSSVQDFIKKAGGLTSNVDKSAIILVYPNGETKLIKSGLFPRNDLILPGSVIYATRDFKKLNNLKFASTLAPIVSSIALSLASLNSISKD